MNIIRTSSLFRMCACVCVVLESPLASQISLEYIKCRGIVVVATLLLLWLLLERIEVGKCCC